MGSGLCPISGNLNFSQFGLPTFLKSPFRDSCRVVEDPQKYDGAQHLRVIRIELPLESRVKLRLWGLGVGGAGRGPLPAVSEPSRC